MKIDYVFENSLANEGSDEEAFFFSHTET